MTVSVVPWETGLVVCDVWSLVADAVEARELVEVV